MELTRINDVAETYGVSSRTLRYYEQAGILRSVHPDNKSQRYYDIDGLERLKQILVLRKLQIPIKDIAEIFKNGNTSALIRAFSNKLESLDSEITALSELRRLVNDFLCEMTKNGIKKISAITLLYEETEKRLALSTKEEVISYKELSKISRDALRLHDVRIIRLPPMRFLSSRLKTGHAAGLDGGNMQNLFSEYGFIPEPGLRNCFYRKELADEWIMLMKIPDDFENTTKYADEFFTGGLFAAASSFMEDLDDTFILLRDWVKNNEYYETDILKHEQVHRNEMIEEILPWDIANKQNRYQQDVFVPIRLKDDFV